MLTQFRTQYPHGGLISELITIDRGQYIVKVTLQVEGITLATGLAADERVESAEDRARERALLALALDSTSHHAESAVTAADRPDSVVNTSSNVVNLSFKQESTASRQVSTTANESNQVKSLNVNTPIDSTTSPGAKRDSGANNHLVDPSNSPLKIDQTNDLASSAAPLSAQESIDSQPIPSSHSPSSLEEETSSKVTSPEKLDNPLPEVSSVQTLETTEFDFNEIKNRTDVEIRRLGWTKEQGRDFLLQTYGKRSRLHLTDQELMDFLHYLESQPT